MPYGFALLDPCVDGATADEIMFPDFPEWQPGMKQVSHDPAIIMGTQNPRDRVLVVNYSRFEHTVFWSVGGRRRYFLHASLRSQSSSETKRERPARRELRPAAKDTHMAGFAAISLEAESIATASTETATKPWAQIGWISLSDNALCPVPSPYLAAAFAERAA